MKKFTMIISAIMLALLAGCSTTSRETQLVPDSKDGMFYTVFADAQKDAAASDKYILLEMWRPG